MLGLLWLAGCSQEPATINYGTDECVHCKMIITDSRFASELVTSKGKAYKFDSIECLAAFQQQEGSDMKDAVLWVSDFAAPDKWVKVSEAIFVQSEVVQSPMGGALLAFATKREAELHLKEKPGKILSWAQVKELKMPM